MKTECASLILSTPSKFRSDYVHNLLEYLEYEPGVALLGGQVGHLPSQVFRNLTKKKQGRYYWVGKVQKIATFGLTIDQKFRLWPPSF